MSKKTRSSSTSTSTATNTPTNPEWVTSGVQNLSGRVMDLLGRDPKSFVAGPSTLQRKAFADAGNLSLSPMYGQAGDIFSRVAAAGANTYDPTGYDSTGYDATDATSQGYDAVDWTGQGYDATTGNATNYDAVMAGKARNYDAVKAGQAQGYDPTSAVASTYSASSLLEGLDKYRSPYAQDVVNTALADYDYGAGQTRANQALDEARSGAFGGSGAAITRALTEDNLTRGRGTLSAGLRDQEFTRATGLSAQDAGFRNDASRFNADAQTRVSMSNADAANAAAAFGANARNTFSLADALAANEAARFNTGESNRFTLADADAANRAAATNADAANRFGLANMDARNAASAFGANARNTSAAANAAARNSALAFGADAGNRATLANAAARNAASAFGADARNTAAAFGANARNEAGRYNAGAMDTALARQLSAGGALANLGSTMGADTRANLALQGQLGGDQRAIDQALSAADINVLNDLAGIYGNLPLNLFTGNTTTGNNTSSGTTKTSDPWGTYIAMLSAMPKPPVGG